MTMNKMMAASVVAGAVFAAGGVSAQTLVTLNPQATNGLGAAGVLSAATPAFQTTGGTLTLGSAATPAVLTINGTAGAATFTETGRIQLQSFTNPALVSLLNPQGTVNSGLVTNYNIFVDFMFSGNGAYVLPNQYQANSAGASFSGTVFATSGLNTIQLGTVSLLPTSTAFGLAMTANAPINGGSGTANTTFSASLNFNPAAGTTGAGGFFQQPTPFMIDIALGSVGGNSGNTNYTVAGGVVTITTPSGGQSPSTGNFTFLGQVPEPGVLSLAGLALVAAGLASRRKSKAVVSA